jgi:hypothetical protein
MYKFALFFGGRCVCKTVELVSRKAVPAPQVFGRVSATKGRYGTDGSSFFENNFGAIDRGSLRIAADWPGKATIVETGDERLKGDGKSAQKRAKRGTRRQAARERDHGTTDHKTTEPRPALVNSQSQIANRRYYPEGGPFHPSGAVHACGATVCGRFLRCYPGGDPCGAVRSVRCQSKVQSPESSAQGSKAQVQTARASGGVEMAFLILVI